MRIIAAALISLAASTNAFAADLISFWDKPRHGGNSFNRLPPDQDYFKALEAFGGKWVRLSYDKWKPEQKDFLLGNADNYTGLAAKDLETLKATLDRANEAGLKVVIAPLSLPFMRWSQNNGGKFDGRLWEDKKNWEEAANFWRDLASQLKDHPAVAGYNIVNEPAPEKEGGLPEHAGAEEMLAWYGKHKGGSRDLPAFYEYVIAAIREADTKTPIMVDSGWFGAADAFTYWQKPLSDTRVIYSFHMYEPYAATSGPNLKRTPPYTYPGKVPFAGRIEQWDRARIAKYLSSAFDWAALNKIPANRMAAGEFGCIRQLSDCRSYLDDVLSLLDAERYHWAFYSFREDAWDAMDYELGKKKVPWSYWDAMEKGLPDPAKREMTPLFEVIRKRL